MKLKSFFVTLLLSVSMICAGLSGASLAQKDAFIEAKADSVPNSQYSGIYSDAFNNTEKYTGYNQVLIVYSGTPHGLTGDAKIITSLDVLNMISINDVPLTSLAIEAWEGQPWVNIYYPNTVAVGDVMKVQSGLTFGATVLEGFKLKLNSSSKWELFNAVEDDPLVKNNDYLLFTPSNVNAATNPPTFAFYNASALNEMADLNFGIQFKLNMTDEELGGYSTLEFGNAIAQHNFVGLLLNYKANTYIYSFKGDDGIDPKPGMTNISLTPDVDHTIEFYCLKVASSTVRFILGIDGKLIFKTSELDATGAVDCLYVNLRMNGAANASKISSLTTTTAAALTRFSNHALHMDTIPTSDESETDACKGESGYYAKAKAYYNKYLVQSQKVEFATSASYADQRARLVAWGAANGEAVSFNESTGEIIIGSNINLLSATYINKNNMTLIIVVSCSLFAISFLSILMVLRKRKHN